VFYTAQTEDIASGDTVSHRFEFTQNPDGTVRRFWQISCDGRVRRQTICDGHYKRASGIATGFNPVP